MHHWVRRLLGLALIAVAAAVAVSQTSVAVSARDQGGHRRATPRARLVSAATTPTPTPAPTPTAASPGAPVSMEKGHNRRHLCAKGLVALTFDDGPQPGTTRRLIGILRREHTPATFFEIGQHVAQHPELSRAVSDVGFGVENHSWSHPRLTKLSDAAVRKQIRSTAAALHAAGVRPGPLMRPPYGAVNPRVLRAIRGLGLTPTLWNVDSNDWRGGSSAQIAGRVLAQLVPQGRRPGGNVVLQHDGVTNSPASVGAVPRIIRTARHRGYCFGSLGPTGRPAPPTPRLSVGVVGGQEGGRPVALTLRLYQPTTVPTSFRLTSSDGTALAGTDYTPLDLTVRFARGVTYAIVRVPVVDDAVAEPPESFTVHLGAPVGLAPVTTSVGAAITDNDPPPPPAG